jgi:hypothetical protein
MPDTLDPVPQHRVPDAEAPSAHFEKTEDLAANSASLPAVQKKADFQFRREDWIPFRSISTLPQVAGVSIAQMRRLVLKELTDNALDAGARVTLGRLDRSGDSYFVEDDGPGIAPENIADLFSLNRPLTSSKLWRMPTRGAMGNGLRVVVGAVTASDGRLEVWTRNQRLILTPQKDGSTAVEASEIDFPVGARIEITFGRALPFDRDALSWAEAAVRMAEGGKTYNGKPSPHWYDADHFFEMLQSVNDKPVRELIAELDGCSGKAGQIAAAFKGVNCNALNQDQASALLQAARLKAKPVSPERLGRVGQLSFLPPHYAIERGTFQTGGREPLAEIPVVVEAWAYADREGEDSSLNLFVNRTPITGEIKIFPVKKKMAVMNCGLNNWLDLLKGSYDITVSIITPHMPIITLGKQPDLSAFRNLVIGVIEKAAKRARRNMPRALAASEAVTQKAVILARLNEGVAMTSGNGEYRFNQRQLFYVLRPFVEQALGVEPTWSNFTGIITDYEDEHGDIPGMYRDPRGTLYQPHTGEVISIGTLAVEEYSRPAWTFNKVLYIEKEGFFEALKSAKWPERHDCALLTSKGFSTRAVRDLLDLLADDGEPVTVFCIHDADASGTMIYQTLQEETKARPRRRVEIINLGLEPWEALDMGLEVESVKERDNRSSVADYVLERPDGAEWVEWLQGNRIELNAMITLQLIEWLDGKMAEHGGEKLVPPALAIVEELDERLTERLRKDIADRILEAAGIDDQVAEARRAITLPTGEDLEEQTGEWLVDNPERHWRDYVDEAARDLSDG